jgi:DNA-binding transcriptional LysR family regulator
MKLSSRALRHFETIRRCGSIRQAARELHLSSSALNRQLLAIEAQLGFSLFERLPSGLHLTPAGEVMARHAIHVMQDEQRMTAELQALRGLQAGHVDVFTVETLTHSFLPTVLDKMAARHPRVTFRVGIGGSQYAASRVIEGEADVAVGFIHERNVNLKQLAVVPFAVGVAVPPEHPFARLKSVRFSQCMRFPMVLPGPELTLRAALVPFLAAQAEAPQVILETASFELMRQIALRGRALVFVNQFGIEADLLARRLVHVPLRDAAPSYLGVYVRARRSLPSAVDAFCERAAEYMKALATY